MEFRQIKRILLIVFGSASLVIGIAGIFLPILPTTPLLLLSAFCYMRSSQRLYHWLIHHKVFGSYIYDYQTYKAISRKVKIIALIFLWLSLALSAYLVSVSYVRIILLLVGIAVTIHILSFKTKASFRNEKYPG